MFSTLIINRCATVSGKSAAITLKVSPSYPSAIWFREHRGEPAPESWNSKDVSNAEGTLELTLLDRIREGRVGVTYTAKVVAAMRSDVDVRPTLPETVCLKFAKQEFSRGLAREAWFYEQIEPLQGVSVPIFYGFFSSPMVEQPGFPNLEFTPWTNRKYSYEDTTDSPPNNINQYPSQDWLPDDVPPYRGRPSHNENPSGYQQNSPWYRWNYTQDNPTVSVIVLELLGETCTGLRGPEVK
ncbi:protein kinase subdomain-containing protein PKL/ccin3 [Coprinopsis cinerea okayama7|uniref:Protein kinase subdomain-containing protein PKL/ccin3 n=1 Tax=Coprinopsis cinerea (strain Okayama-7 / 130 / ATCC MYA-4618 / FGSC 9003) TaxID=240176 RepID=A8PE90_COPC7|nr:protein kinase subdomain-containing protein PKL/ccin3 [Coprinopsis cinerea okayama7\|eukprot:XP_001840748.1 protein kinase subdomain-containing protein PKL/ccin3 [Coprinopsis cinerea okayama7\